MSKSSTSWLMETFMTAVSSTIRNWAVPSTIGASRFLTVATSPGQAAVARGSRRGEPALAAITSETVARRLTRRG
ncbi:hypothetical protein [Streptomyces wedmorensis]|uniref:hypothetical protein n=1 Tax=Streptomyces wedmorensis TaxID=43759 RepID=UPI003796251F